MAKLRDMTVIQLEGAIIDGVKFWCMGTDGEIFNSAIQKIWHLPCDYMRFSVCDEGLAARVGGKVNAIQAVSINHIWTTHEEAQAAHEKLKQIWEVE